MNESRRAVARWRVRVCTGYGAVSHAAVSCRVQCFSVRGAVRCHVSGKSLPPNPKGVTLTVAHTALSTLPVCSCRGGPERLGSIPLGFCELASAECVNLSTRVTRGSGHRDPQPRTPRLWGGRTPFAPRSKRESGHQTSRPRTPRFCRSGHQIRPSPLKNHKSLGKRETKNCTCNQRAPPRTS